MDVNAEELSKLNLGWPLAGTAASVTIRRPSSVDVQISLLHCHCFKSKTWHSPPKLSFVQSAERCQCLMVSVLTIAELAGATCCMNLRDAAVPALEHRPSHC